jgi:hypothetical protein
MWITKRNSRSVALAVRVVAGLVDEDSNVRLLLAGPGEYNGEREPMEEDGMVNHGRVLFLMWLEASTALAELYTLGGRQRHSIGHVPWWRWTLPQRSLRDQRPPPKLAVGRVGGELVGLWSERKRARGSRGLSTRM